MMPAKSRTMVESHMAVCAVGLTLVAVFFACLGPKAAANGRSAELSQDGAEKIEVLTKDVTQGALRIVKEDGQVVECPLKHTDVKAEVSGFIARVTVTQTFLNPLDEKIEAVYVFPLPHKAAVDDMTMVVGQRRIVGIIKRRAEARRIYEESLARGATAALLEQERPNIFTQSVGNIGPNQEVKIEISYVDVLEYDLGVYEFHFPMVVGPRYIPGRPTSKIPPVPKELKGKVGELDKNKVPEGQAEPKGRGWAPDTDRVPDASRITPPVLKPGYRNGHDISLSIKVDAGVPIQDLKVTNHKAKVTRTGPGEADAKLSPADSIPNKDFVLKYAVVGKKPEMAVLTHTDDTGQGYFMLMIQPKEDDRLKKTPPREIVFLVDVSGSMSGEPTAKVIEAMGKFLKLCKAQDTIQVITFAGRAQKLFDKAVPVTPENVGKALNFTGGLRGRGGTEMLKGIKMAINEPLDPERIRIVIMLSDGYIGNEAEIIKEVGQRCGDQIRFWCVGIGQSPNRFLLDGVARQGGGMSKVLGLKDDSTALVQEVMFRIHRAQLAKIKIDWGRLKVFETYPAKIPELWAGRPVILFGRYEPGGGESRINISGKVEGEPATWALNVQFPAEALEHDVLAKIWARNKIEELMHQTYYAGSPLVEEEVTSIALKYRLMSQYTSFVAVDESELAKMTEPARPPRRMLVPVPIPEGTRYEGFFGPAEEGEGVIAFNRSLGQSMRKSKASGAAWHGTLRRSNKSLLSLREARYAGGSGRMLLAARGVAGPAMQPAPTAMPVGAFGIRRGRAIGGKVFRDDQLAELAGEAYAYTYRVFAAHRQELTKKAETALKVAEELQRQDKFLPARAKFAHAYLLGAAVASPNIPQKALEAIEQINKRVRQSWGKEIPRLNERLQIVIRNKSIPEALQSVAEAGSIKIKLLAGSLEDAAGITRQRDLRVTYLDLRNATVAQALDWILRPARMTWWVENNRIVAGTARRGPGESTWVYDVSILALPSAKEFQAIKDHQKRLETAKKEADKFLQSICSGMNASDAEIVWYAPGQLLVFGDAKMHEKTAKLFDDLADPNARPEGKLAELHKTTSKRAVDRKEAAAKSLATRERVHVYESLRANSWRLLAAAAAGELDLEALTELQVAWGRPETAELLKGPGAVIVLHSLWAVTEAAAALPKEEELASLAGTARKISRQAINDVVAALEKSPEDVAAYFKTLYAALAMKDNEDYLGRAVPLLTKSSNEKSALTHARKVAAVLLLPAKKANAKTLIEVISKGVHGEDMVVLTALACRRAGGEPWTKFRAEARNLLSDQPLSGSVVVFVSHLSEPDMKLLSALE